MWVDVVSPVCYLAKRRLEEAVHAFEHPAVVAVRYRSYQVGAVEQDVGTLPAQEMEALAERDGLRLDLAAVRPAGSFDAHRLIQLGLASGGPAEQSAVLERLFSACLSEGRAVDDRTTLQRLAAEAGLDERRVAAVLAAEDYAAEVREDEALAAQLGIAEVPHLLVDGRYPLTGAQPVEAVLGLLREAWTARG